MIKECKYCGDVYCEMCEVHSCDSSKNMEWQNEQLRNTVQTQIKEISSLKEHQTELEQLIKELRTTIEENENGQED